MNPDDILRLADECEESAHVWAHEIDTRKRAAAELRRLHAQTAQDEALLRQALEYLERSVDNYPIGYCLSRQSHENTIAALRERLGLKE